MGLDLGDRSSAYCVLNEAGGPLSDRSSRMAGPVGNQMLPALLPHPFAGRNGSVPSPEEREIELVLPDHFPVVTSLRYSPPLADSARAAAIAFSTSSRMRGSRVMER
jgi:hypothetical protein